MRLSIFILILLFNNLALSKTLEPQLVYQPIKPIPAELELALKSLQRNPPLKSLDPYGPMIHKIDDLLVIMPTADAYFLIKTEIYKTSLKFKKRTRKYNFKEKGEDIIRKLAQQLGQKEKQYSAFSHWIMNAIQTDFQNIFKSPLSKRYFNYKLSKRTLKGRELLKIDKKFSLLLPWYLDFTTLTPLEWEKGLDPLYLVMVDNIITTLTYYKNFSGDLQKKNNLAKKKELQFFKKSEISPLENVKEDEINEILSKLSPDPSYIRPKNLPIPTNEPNWYPKEHAKYLPPKSYPKIDPSYNPPTTLPAPTDDWFLEL